MEAYCSKSDGKSADASKKVVFEPMRIGPISTLEEMDIKVLKFQNKKLAMVKIPDISYSPILLSFYLLIIQRKIH